VSLPGEPSGALIEPMPAIAAPRPRRDWSSRTRISADQAERYSRFVILAKRGLLVAAGILIAAVLVYSLQPRQREQLAMSFQRLGIVNNDLAMIKPRLAGVDEEGDPYVVTAERAIQDHANAKRAQLANIEADVTLKDGTWLGATAPYGLLDATARTLSLAGAVAIYSDKGYEAHTAAANVDMDSGMIRGNQAVSGQGPLGTFRADRFKIDRDSNVAYLYGNVRMTVYGHGLGGK
jgi:lipopolysaccharide export system protein LptC